MFVEGILLFRKLSCTWGFNFYSKSTNYFVYCLKICYLRLSCQSIWFFESLRFSLYIFITHLYRLLHLLHYTHFCDCNALPERYGENIEIGFIGKSLINSPCEFLRVFNLNCKILAIFNGNDYYFPVQFCYLIVSKNNSFTHLPDL